MSMNERKIHMFKRCLRVSKTQDQHQLFISSLSIVVFIKKMTYNHINLNDQNSLDMDHNTNPTFDLMNNQSNHLKILEALSQTPKNMFIAQCFFSGVDFWHLLCLLRLNSPLAHQLQDSILEIFVTIQLNGPGPHYDIHISYLDYTTQQMVVA